VTNGQTGSVTVTVTAPYTTISAPSGTVTYTVLNSSNSSVASGTLTLTVGSGSSTATIPIPNTLPPGNYTITVTYSGDGNYLVSASSITIQLQIGQIAPTVSVVSSSNPVLVTNAVTFTATVSSTAGTPTGSVSFFDGTTLLGTVALAQAQGSSQPVVSSKRRAKLAAANHLVAKSAAPSNPTAAFTTSSLAEGSHTITAVYNGDSTFSSITSSQLAQVVQDFTVTASPATGSGGGTSPSQTVLPGGTATYSLALGPTNGTTFPVPLTISVSGLPPGATATVTPQVIPAGSPLTNITLRVQVANNIASLDHKQPPNRGIPPTLWSVLLLPFAFRLRRAGKKLSRKFCILLMLAAGIAVTAVLSGCGSGNGFFGQQPGTYTVRVTGTAGAVSHSTTVMLTVQ
jgi:hypothetical protein